MGGRGWIIPGGKVEPFEVDNPSVSAIREAREEGGVRGCLIKCRLISFIHCLDLLLQANWADIWGSLRTKRKGTELECSSCTWRASTRRRSGRSLSERDDGSLCRTPRRSWRKINPITWNTSRQWSRLRRWQSHEKRLGIFILVKYLNDKSFQLKKRDQFQSSKLSVFINQWDRQSVTQV